jgi:chaperonin cofactor prefoldin
MIPTEELKKKSEVLLVDKKNIEGQLGEIKCVNTEIWKILKDHLR